MNQRYKKYKPMIINLAHKYSIKGFVGMEFNDLYSIGNEVFLETEKIYNPEIGSFSTLLYGMLQKKFKWMNINAYKVKKNFLNDSTKSIVNESKNNTNRNKSNFLFFEQSELPSENSISDSHKNYDIEKLFMFFESLDSLSQDSKKIMNLVLDMPDDLKDYFIDKTGGRVNKTGVQRYLLDKDWKIGQIYNSFAEIKNIMKQ